MGAGTGEGIHNVSPGTVSGPTEVRGGNSVLKRPKSNRNGPRFDLAALGKTTQGKRLVMCTRGVMDFMDGKRGGKKNDRQVPPRFDDGKA